MTGGPAQGLKSGWRRGLRTLGMLVWTAVMLYSAGIPTTWRQQTVVALAIVAFALTAGKLSSGSVPTLILVLASCVSTLRYGVWRVVTVGHVLRVGGTRSTLPGDWFVVVLLGAELYSLLNLGLGYFQMVWPLRRAPVPLPQDTELWPEVDLLIPTLDEPLEVVKYTALGALNMDWPPDKLNVYVLDDGRREELRSFCAEAGIGYMIREGNESAKAGNLNRALERTHAAFVAVFDADHVPVRSFLQMTMGWFERDPMLGLVQTPHHLYSADPFERNLHRSGAIPNEGELFYGVVQDGNDLWNAAYFCGTGAVLRRAALDSVGGMATETLTEDAHTSLRMQKKGWGTAYINLPLAAGLATERLGDHIRQRRRWARGMAQVLRLENPLFAAGLTWPQRLCYFHAAIYFFNALPRLVFLIAPLMYLVLGRATIPGYWAAVLAYAAPHLMLGYAANARLHGRHRFSFWNEIYETVLAPFLLLPTLAGFLFPRMGKFEATPKGDAVERGFFDSRAAWPLVLLFCGNAFGLACAGFRVLSVRMTGVRLPHGAQSWANTLYRGSDLGPVWMNVAWTVFNLMILSVAISVARETLQRRRAVSLQRTAKAALVFSDGRWAEGTTEDVSSGGLLLRSSVPIKAGVREAVTLILSLQGQETVLPATVVEAVSRAVRVHFDPLTVREEEGLATVLYAAADSWIGRGMTVEPDCPLKSLGRVAALAFAGIRRALGAVGAAGSGPMFALAVGLLPIGMGWVVFSSMRSGAQAAPAREVTAGSIGQTHAGVTERRTLLRDLSAPVRVEPGRADSGAMHFGAGTNEVIERASLRLRYRFVDGRPHDEPVDVILNGLALSADPATRNSEDDLVSSGFGHAGWRELRWSLPPELLVRDNGLEVRLLAPAQRACASGSCSDTPIEVDTSASALDVFSRSFTVAPAPVSGAMLSKRFSPEAWARQRFRGELFPPLHRAVWAVSATISVCAALSCLALAYLLRATLRERALLRLQI